MLNNFQAQLQKLELDLQNPSIFNDPKKLKEISQKHKELKEKIEIMKEIEEVKRAIEATQDMIKEEKEKSRIVPESSCKIAVSSHTFRKKCGTPHNDRGDDDKENEELIKIAQEELKELENKKKRLEEKLTEVSSPETALNKKNIIMEIRAGVGGDEAELFASDLFRMYSRFAEKKSWQTSLLSSQSTGINGLKEVIFEIKGTDVYGQLKNERGVHRVQRIPVTEKSGRIHTSTATVAVLPEAEEIDFKINPKDLRIDTYRSSGAGGQHVNKTSSAVRIIHLPTNLMVACQDGRSQHQNKEKAMMILRSRLLAQEEEKARLARIEERRTMIGTGDRSEKIRTYNFPQNRVTDHRVKKSWYGIDNIMNGEIEEIIKAFS